MTLAVRSYWVFIFLDGLEMVTWGGLSEELLGKQQEIAGGSRRQHT
jgi:hypothetical protein